MMAGILSLKYVLQDLINIQTLALDQAPVLSGG